MVPRPGHEHRRAVDLLKWDIDALEEVIERSGVRPPMMKVQAAGPWTLTAGIEMARGHRVLTDQGALREFAASLGEGVSLHAAEVSRRIGAPVVVQLDEPSLPTILAGGLRRPPATAPSRRSPMRTHGTSWRRDRRAEGVDWTAGDRALLRARPPVGLLRSAGADALAIDATLLEGIPAALSDQFGEAWDAGVTMLLGLVPSTAPNGRPSLEQLRETGIAAGGPARIPPFDPG